MPALLQAFRDSKPSAHNLPPDQIAQYKEVFEIFVRDGLCFYCIMHVRTVL